MRSLASAPAPSRPPLPPTSPTSDGDSLPSDGDDEDDEDEGDPPSSPDGSPSPSRRDDIASLPPVDHSLITYEPLVRRPYLPHPSLLPSSSSPASSALTPPCPDLSLLPLPPAVIAALSTHLATSALTPVQSQAIPLALLHRDLIALAPTGSGKTLAYLLPLFLHLSHQPPLPPPTPPRALVLVPTRELGEQVWREARRLAQMWGEGWRVSALLGGANRYEQTRLLSKGVEVVIATPGRLLDLVAGGWARLGQCGVVVLDEADRLLSLGFDRQIRALMTQIRPDRQILLFSATWGERVGRLARDLLSDPVRVGVGEEGVVGGRGETARSNRTR